MLHQKPHLPSKDEIWQNEGHRQGYLPNLANTIINVLNILNDRKSIKNVMSIKLTLPGR